MYICIFVCIKQKVLNCVDILLKIKFTFQKITKSTLFFNALFTALVVKIFLENLCRLRKRQRNLETIP